MGDLVDVYLTSLGKTYKGKVRQIGNFINPNNRSFGIEVSVPNPENLLRPNQVAKLKITDYTSAKAVVVPSNVIQEDADGKLGQTCTDCDHRQAGGAAGGRVACVR